MDISFLNDVQSNGAGKNNAEVSLKKKKKAPAKIFFQFIPLPPPFSPLPSSFPPPSPSSPSSNFLMKIQTKENMFFGRFVG